MSEWPACVCCCSVVCRGLWWSLLLHPDPACAAGGLCPLLERVLGGQDGDGEPQGLVRRSVTQNMKQLSYLLISYWPFLIPSLFSVARSDNLQLHPVVHRHRALLCLLHHAWRLPHQQVLHQLQHAVLCGGLHHLGAAESPGTGRTSVLHLQSFKATIWSTFETDCLFLCFT